jgi:hypothetical protein
VAYWKGKGAAHADAGAPRDEDRANSQLHLPDSPHNRPTQPFSDLDIIPRALGQQQPARNTLDADARLSLDAHRDSYRDRNVPLTPLQAIRTKCLWCCDGSAREVWLCPVEACPSWPFRFGHKPSDEIIAEQGNTPLHPLEWPITAAEFHAERSSALKAIQRKCLDCSGASKSEVRNCPCDDCALHPFRQGKNPNRTYRPEERARRSEHLARLKIGRAPIEKPVSIGDLRANCPETPPVS